MEREGVVDEDGDEDDDAGTLVAGGDDDDEEDRAAAVTTAGRQKTDGAIAGAAGVATHIREQPLRRSGNGLGTRLERDEDVRRAADWVSMSFFAVVFFPFSNPFFIACGWWLRTLSP